MYGPYSQIQSLGHATTAWYCRDEETILWVDIQTGLPKYVASVDPYNRHALWSDGQLRFEAVNRVDADGNPSSEQLYEGSLPRFADALSHHQHRHTPILEASLSDLWDRGLKAIKYFSGLWSDPDSLEHIARLTDPKDALLWYDQDSHVPTRLEFPSLDLEFIATDTKGQRQWVSPQYPGYCLAGRQHLASLGRAGNYLILEPLSGDERSTSMVLMSVGSFKSPDLTTKSSLDPAMNRNEWIMDKLVIFDIAEDGELIPRTLQERLYLAIHYLWQHDYELAAYYLRGYGTLLRPIAYGSDEGNLFYKLTNLDNNDHDMRARAVRLLAHYLLAEAKSDFPTGEKYNPDQYSSDYFAYLTNAEWASEILLQPHEELFLASPFQDRDIVKARIAQLKARIQQQPPEVDLELKSFQYMQRRSKTLQYDDENALNAIMRGFYSDGDEKPSLLSPVLGREVCLAYSAAKGEIDGKELLKAIEELTGIRLDEALPQKAHDYWSELLAFLQTCDLRASDASLVEFLMAVTRDPHSFPSVTNFDEIIAQARLNTMRPLLQVLQTVKLDTREIKARNYPAVVRSDQSFSDGRAKPRNQDALLRCALPPYNEEPPFVNDPSSYITEKPASADTKAQHSATRDALTQLFSFPEVNPLLERSAEKLRDSLEGFDKKFEQEQKNYEIVCVDRLRNLHDELSETVAEIKLSQDQRRQDIAQRALQLPEVPAERAYETLKRISHLDRELLLEELVKLYATQDVELLMSRNPALTLEDAIDLYERIGAFMLEATRMNHLERVISLIDQIEHMSAAESLHSHAPQSSQSSMVSKLHTQLNFKRAYNVAQHPAYLSFEYALGIMLRPEQVHTLDLLGIENGTIRNAEQIEVVLEMIMGAGKTTVLLPLLGQMIADGERLAILIMPETLLPSMSERFQKSFGDSFGQGCEILEVDRYVGGLGIENITYILDRLEAAKRDRRVVMISNSSVQSLYLSFLMRLKQYEELRLAGIEGQEVLESEAVVRNYQKIFVFLRSFGVVILDEIDAIMDVLKSHHFTTGENRLVHADTLMAVTGLYELLLNPDMAHVLPLPFLGQTSTNPFTDDNYQGLLKPLLIDAILEGRYLPHDESFQAFIKKLKDVALLRSYLANEPREEAFEFVSRISDVHVRNILAVVQEELTSLLPLTSRKHLFVHYGPSKERACAIPYQLGRPSERSDFGTELEIINYTTQMILEKGLAANLVGKEVERLKAFVKSPVTRNQALVEIEELFSGSDLKIFTITEGEYEELAKHVNKNPKVVLRVGHRQILQHIRSHSQQLNANAQIYGFLFKVVHGFTGTLWNADTFPRIFDARYPSDTQERTLFTLWDTTPAGGADHRDL